jgi:hypothetical protein
MNYEQWDQQTTELQNEHGHTCKPKPLGPLAKTSVYEFINDWLPAQLAWHILGSDFICQVGGSQGAGGYGGKSMDGC